MAQRLLQPAASADFAAAELRPADRRSSLFGPAKQDKRTALGMRLAAFARWLVLAALPLVAGCYGTIDPSEDEATAVDEPTQPARSTSSAGAAVPYQFIAKLYSEALGRAPDAQGWQTHVDYFRAAGCNAATLATIAGNIFDSGEYRAKGYSPREAVLTLYRAVLSREPDKQGFSHFVGFIRDRRWTPAQVARSMAGSPEFSGLVRAICAGRAYRRDWGRTQAIDIGGGTWSQRRLKRCLTRSKVCSVPPRVVVYLSSTLAIPKGHVLQTQGRPGRRRYARQARLVRAAPFGHLVKLGAGAQLRDIWLSGQRHLYGSKSRVAADGVRANVYYSADAKGAAIAGTRLEFPLQRTNIEAHGRGSLRIADNLIVDYTAAHEKDGTWTWVADGISAHHANTSIRKNDIIDPTDVGIVIFGHDRWSAKQMVQASVARGNRIVHAGNSAYGSLVFDTIYQCHHCRFSGSMTHNLILAGREVHSDIMLSVGTGPWKTPAGAPSNDHLGYGATMSDNRTIWGDANQRVRVQVGIAVDGMLNATVQGNRLYIEPQKLGRCYRGKGVMNDLAHHHASGRLMLEGDGSVHGCIGH